MVLLLGAACLATGCGPAVASSDGANSDSDSDGGTSSTSGDVSPPGTSAPPMPATSPPDPTLPPVTTATTEPPDTGSTSGTDGDPTDPTGCFFGGCGPDGGTTPIECDLLMQDCPRGEKCAPWANDGGSAWNATKCVPVENDPDAVGEPCTVEGSGVSGIDSCDDASMCFNVDSDTNTGECFAFCEGDYREPTCDDGFVCPVSGDGVLLICIPTCDPTVSSSCGESEVCVPYYDGRFVCAPNADLDGAFLDPCAFVNACDPGLMCISPDALDACDNGSGCCTPFCDLGQPDCPDTTTCAAYFEDGGAPEGLEHVGVCIN